MNVFRVNWFLVIFLPPATLCDVCLFVLLGFGHTLSVCAGVEWCGAARQCFYGGPRNGRGADSRRRSLRGSCQALVPFRWPRRL